MLTDPCCTSFKNTQGKEKGRYVLSGKEWMFPNRNDSFLKSQNHSVPETSACLHV